MGNMDGQSGNVTSTTFLHHLSDLWKSPRGTVLRIEFLAGVAIILAFLVAAFGSSRRWSNRWVVQKGFFGAHALSLSLGTYSIGLMQTSPVKSEMFPIWTVCLFALFGCIDPVTTYIGVDYKGPLSKIVFGIFLQCGYVLVMSNSVIFSDTGNTSISILAAITFIKSFHRSLALVQQSRMRNMVQYFEGIYNSRNDRSCTSDLVFDFITTISNCDGRRDYFSLEDISYAFTGNFLQYEQLCYDACIAFCRSHKLQWYFLGLGHPITYPKITLEDIDYTCALKLIEIELAFLYDIFFTGNPFLHYYQAKTASLWSLASFIGICFVGVGAAIPGTMTSRRPGGSTKVLDTTTADLVITFVILVSLAQLQLMHLMQGWTSNWARCAIAWSLARKNFAERQLGWKMPRWWPWWIRLKVYVATSTKWFPKYLWQDKIGQCSILPKGRSTLLENGKEERLSGQKKGFFMRRQKKGGWEHRRICILFIYYYLYDKFSFHVVNLFGLDYIWEVLQDLLGSDTNKRGAVRLDDDVKGYIIKFLGQIETDRIDGNWLSFPDEHPIIHLYLPYYIHVNPLQLKSGSHGYRYTVRYFMLWHTVTWYCEQLEQEREEQDALSKPNCTETAAGERERNQNKNRYVANVVSKYCIYLVVSAPELLPGTASETKFAKDFFAKSARAAMQDGNKNPYHDTPDACASYSEGMDFANRLLGIVTRHSDPWEMLAHVWARLLVYAAPYGNVEAHMQHLAKGGEFITHLWALLYHHEISEWKLPEANNNLHNITTEEDAQRILTEDHDDLDIVIIFYISSRWLPDGRCSDEFVAASRLIDGVRFYLTTFDVIRTFLYTLAYEFEGTWGAVFLNKAEKKFAFFDSGVHGSYSPCNVALFVYETKLAWAKERAQEAAPSTFHNGIPIEKQSSEDGQTQTVVEIEEEI